MWVTRKRFNPPKISASLLSILPLLALPIQIRILFEKAFMLFTNGTKLRDRLSRKKWGGRNDEQDR